MTNPNVARFGDLSPEEQKKWNERFAREQDNFALGASAMTKAFELQRNEDGEVPGVFVTTEIRRMDPMTKAFELPPLPPLPPLHVTALKHLAGPFNDVFTRDEAQSYAIAYAYSHARLCVDAALNNEAEIWLLLEREKATVAPNYLRDRPGEFRGWIAMNATHTGRGITPYAAALDFAAAIRSLKAG
jgi:hypothetical protein